MTAATKKASVSSKGKAKPDPAPTPKTYPSGHICEHIKPDGKRCGARSVRGGQYCIGHQRSMSKPSNPDAWQPIDITTKDGVSKFVNEVANRVAGGKMTTKVSYALVPHVANMINLLEEKKEAPEEPVHEADPLPAVLEILDAHPDAKAALIKRMDQESK